MIDTVNIGALSGTNVSPLVTELAKQADLNGDGTVSQSEFAQFLTGLLNSINSLSPDDSSATDPESTSTSATSPQSSCGSGNSTTATTADQTASAATQAAAPGAHRHHHHHHAAAAAGQTDPAGQSATSPASAGPTSVAAV